MFEGEVVALMKERSDSNNFNSLTATLIELRTSRCPARPINSNHEHSTRFNSHRGRSTLPPTFPPRPLFYFFSHAVWGGLNEFALASPRSNHRSKVGEEVLTREGGFIEQFERWQRECLSLGGRRLCRLTDWTVGWFRTR